MLRGRGFGVGGASHRFGHVAGGDRIARSGATGAWLREDDVRYLLTGDSGSISSATTSLICCSERMPAWPKRGMNEQAE